MTDGDGHGPSGSLFDATVRDGVVRLSKPGTRWHSTGWRGGRITADAAYSVTVPEGWSDRDVSGYVRRRIEEAFDEGEASEATSGTRPVLLTGVDARHARGARYGPVEAFATAGLSNPAALDVPDRPPYPAALGFDADDGPDATGSGENLDPAGTVNLVVATTRNLPPHAFANLIAVAAETKAATLLSVAGVPGTTTDAVVVACDPEGRRERYSGSATLVGRAARICVRDALLAALWSRYPDGEFSDPDAAEHAVTTEDRAAVFRIATGSNPGTEGPGDPE